MKKILTAALFVAATAFTARANDINAKAIASFNLAFKDAKNIVWTEVENTSQVAFDWNNQHLKIFYNAEGEQSAMLKPVEVSQMPTLVQLKVQNYLKDYDLKEAMELNSTADGLCYYISLNNDKKEMVVKLSSNGEATIVKKLKK